MSHQPDANNCEHNRVYGNKPIAVDLTERNEGNREESHFEDDDDCADFNLGIAATSPPDLNLLATFAESLSSANCASEETLQDISGTIYTSYLSEELMFGNDINNSMAESRASSSTSSASDAKRGETDAMLAQHDQRHVLTCQPQVSVSSSYDTYYTTPAPIYTSASSSSFRPNTNPNNVPGEGPVRCSASCCTNYNASYMFHSYSTSCAAPRCNLQHNSSLPHQEMPTYHQSTFRESSTSGPCEPKNQSYSGNSFSYGRQPFDDFLYQTPTTTAPDNCCWTHNNQSIQTPGISSFNSEPEYGTYPFNCDPPGDSLGNDSNYFTYPLLSDSTHENKNYAANSTVLPPAPAALQPFWMPMPYHRSSQPVYSNDYPLYCNGATSKPAPSQGLRGPMGTSSSSVPAQGTNSGADLAPLNLQKSAPPASATAVSRSYTFGEQQNSSGTGGCTSETTTPVQCPVPVSSSADDGVNFKGTYFKRDSLCNSGGYSANTRCNAPDVFCSICYPNVPDSSLQQSQMSQQRTSSKVSVVKQQNQTDDGTCVQQRRLVTVREMLLERARLRMEQVTSTLVNSEVTSNVQSTGSGVKFIATAAALHPPSAGQEVQVLSSYRKPCPPQSGFPTVRVSSPALPYLIVKNPSDPARQMQIPIRSVFPRPAERHDSAAAFSILRARLLAAPQYPLVKKPDVSKPPVAASGVAKREISVIKTGPETSGNSSRTARLSTVKMPSVGSTSTGSEKTSSSHENKPPKHYDMECLEIGSFKVAKPSPTAVFGKHVNRFKVFFIKRKFTYEFAVSTAQVPERQINVAANMAMIEVPFSIVKAMRFIHQNVLIAVDGTPQLYLGTRNDRQGTSFNTVHFDRGRPTDITFGQLRVQQTHKIILRTRQIENLQSLLEDFDPKFKELLKSTFFGALPEFVLPPITNEHLTSERTELETRSQAEDISTRKRQCVIENCADSQVSAKKSLSEVLCHCQVSCRSNRCSCMKSKLKCGTGTSDCMCKLCDNPLNLLDDVGINLEEAVADICLVQSIVSYKDDLRSLLEKRVRFPCCGKRELVKNCVPGLTSCQNSSCNSHRIYKFSWCQLKLFDEETSPRNHCAACKSCKDPIDLHCQACRRCNPVEGNCTRCTVCGAFRDTSYTEQDNVKIVLKRYRQCKQRFEHYVPSIFDEVPSDMQGEGLAVENGEAEKHGEVASIKNSLLADKKICYMKSNLATMDKRLTDSKYCAEEQPSSTTPHSDGPVFRGKSQNV